VPPSFILQFAICNRQFAIPVSGPTAHPFAQPSGNAPGNRPPQHHVLRPNGPAVRLWMKTGTDLGADRDAPVPFLCVTLTTVRWPTQFGPANDRSPRVAEPAG
jgi:hypothetical protein